MIMIRNDIYLSLIFNIFIYTCNLTITHYININFKIPYFRYKHASFTHIYNPHFIITPVFEFLRLMIIITFILILIT
jgi:hypothetical protein